MAAERPPNAPYHVDVGEPVEICVVESDDASTLIVEFEFMGDKFGGSLYSDDVGDPGTVGHTTALDELLASVARIAWHELGLTPTFREEDAKWTGRVDVQRPWERERRVPTMGWIENEDEVRGVDAEPEPEPTTEAVQPEPVTVESTDDFEREFGKSATVTMTPEEMQQVARGEVPEAFLARVNRQRPDYELLDEVEAVLEIAHGNEVVSEQKIATAYRALNELRRRSTGVGS